MINPFAERQHSEMLDVLMDQNAAGPAVHYYMIRGGSERKNLTVWQSGLVGEEYIKTYGHYHVSDFVETYEVLNGEGIILLQERKQDSEGKPIDEEVAYVKAIFVKKGSKVAIPERAGHLGINTGGSWLVTLDDSPVNLDGVAESAWPKHADYGAVKKMRGFAYYVIKQDGAPAFVKNPKYKNTPDIIIEKM
jgi:glucose-6-phosphate isomerase